MENKRCVIFAAGDYFGGFIKKDGDLIIAADAGWHHLKALSITPDILLGDFDTIGTLPDHRNIISYNPEKDYTDTELAILEGVRLGYNEFLICGAVGGKRLEHTYANIALAAAYAEKGYDITLTDGNYMLKAIHNSSLSLPEKKGGYVSVFPLCDKAEGVTITGLKYTLSDYVLDKSRPTLGVSNEFIGETSSVSVKCGTLIIIWNEKEI